jgi:hypothetical protein
MADVSHLDATRCRIVGGQVTSEMTVLSLLEVTCLRRGACHAGLSLSLDRAHFDAGAPGRDRRGSLRRATGRATTPHAREPERLLQSRARLRAGTMGWKGRLSPRGRDRVVVHVVEETRIQGSLGDPLSETGAHDFERADAAEDHTESEEGIHGTESRGKPGVNRSAPRRSVCGPCGLPRVSTCSTGGTPLTSASTVGARGLEPPTSAV